MKPARTRTPLRLKGTLFALAIAAMATQAGSAPLSPQVASAPPEVHSSAALASLPDAGALLAPLASLQRGPPVSGSWALLLAGLAGVVAIGRRRMSGSLSFDPQRLRRR